MAFRICCVKASVGDGWRKVRNESGTAAIVASHDVRLRLMRGVLIL